MENIKNGSFISDLNVFEKEILEDGEPKEDGNGNPIR